MAQFSKIVRFDAMKSLAFGGISAAFAALGSANTHQVRLLKLVNSTNGDMIISFDGITPNDFVPAGGFVLYDFGSDAFPNNQFIFEVGTQIWVKQSTAPTSGSVYAISVYGKGE